MRHLTVLNPESRYDISQTTPLAERLDQIQNKTIFWITANQKGSQMEWLMERLCSIIREKYQNVNLVFRHKPSEYPLDDPEFWKEVAESADAFVYGAAPSSSTTHWSARWSGGLEKRGLPGVIMIYSGLEGPLNSTIEAYGIPLRSVVASYPALDMEAQHLEILAQELVIALTKPLNEEEKTIRQREQRAFKEEFHLSEDDVQEFFYHRGWTDGLPVIAPTKERVAEMLNGTKHLQDVVVTESMWPEKRKVTVRQVAINAVMAGCKTEYLPILLASVEAFGKSNFNSAVRSTNAFSFMQVVNGPIAEELEMNGQTYALGPGNHANATIGRALRLFIINLGGGKVKVNMMSTQGNPSAYSFCFPENEDKSPWDSLAVSQGFTKKESTISIFSGGWSHAGNYLSGDLEQLSKDVRFFEWPSGVVILMSPKAAKMQADKGFTKEEAETLIWQNAKLTAKEFRNGLYYSWFAEPVIRRGDDQGDYNWPTEVLDCPDDEMISIYPRNGVKIVVVGGEANPMMQAWKMEGIVTTSVDKWR